MPIAITLDPHANVSNKMCALADIIVSFKTYPHIDMRDTGRHAGEILHRTMAGEIQPHTILVSRPMLEEVNGGRTDIGPLFVTAAHVAPRVTIDCPIAMYQGRFSLLIRRKTGLLISVGIIMLWACVKNYQCSHLYGTGSDHPDWRIGSLGAMELTCRQSFQIQSVFSRRAKKSPTASATG